MGKWLKEHVWTTATIAMGTAWAALAKMLDVLGLMTMGDRIDAATSYWFKFLDWWFSMPSWISGVFFAVVLIISISRQHPALIVAANKLKKSDPRVRLCTDLRRVGSRFRHIIGSSPEPYSRDEQCYIEEVGNWIVTSARMKRLGFSVPNVDIQHGGDEALRKIITFVDWVEPLIRSHDIKQAKKKAAELAA